jgi:hypothetical protein
VLICCVLCSYLCDTSLADMLCALLLPVCALQLRCQRARSTGRHFCLRKQLHMKPRCVCVCLCLCMYVCMRMYVCVCMCVLACVHATQHTLCFVCVQVATTICRQPLMKHLLSVCKMSHIVCVNFCLCVPRTTPAHYCVCVCVCACVCMCVLVCACHAAHPLNTFV